MQDLNLIQRILKNRYVIPILNINLLLSSIGAIVADVLTPIAPFSLWVGGGCIIILSIAILIQFITKADQFFQKLIGNAWCAPTIIVLIIATVMMFGTYFLSKKEGNNGGYLASKFPHIEAMQRDLGLIAKYSKETAENTKIIADNTNKISTQIKNVKKEVSVDPRKEIANLGLSWSIDDFSNALRRGDLTLIELFLKGGMKPTDMRNGASVLLYGMQPKLNNNPTQILRLMKRYGYNIDKHLSDATILKHWHKNLPPYYRAVNKPSGYSSNRFSGPLLMWVVILSTYQGATVDDIAIIDFLISEGAEKDTTLSYLKFCTWLHDTSPYHKIRPMLDK